MMYTALTLLALLGLSAAAKTKPHVWLIVADDVSGCHAVARP